MINPNLPNKIGQYNLIRKLTGAQFTGSYTLGIYRNRNGKQFFVKRWTGKFHDIGYKWLKNEANIYNQMSGSKDQSITLPQFVDFIEDSNSATLIIEYIKGQHITGLSQVKKATIYSQILYSLANSRIDIDLKQRPPLYWLAITPLATIIAVAKNMRSWRVILRGLVKVIANSSLVINRVEKSLVHRDLNDNNIMIVGKKIYLLDFELSVLSDPLVDIAIVLLKNNNDDSFISEFKKNKYVNTILQDDSRKAAVNCYMAIFSLYDLCFQDGLHTASLKYLASL